MGNKPKIHGKSCKHCGLHLAMICVNLVKYNMKYNNSSTWIELRLFWEDPLPHIDILHANKLQAASMNIKYTYLIKINQIKFTN